MNVLKQIAVVIALAVSCPVLAAPTESFPTKPLKLIVPFAVGGPTDILARILGETLGEKLGQPVIVDNKGGAGGSIGSEAVAFAEPDGYTIGLATISTHVVNPSCNRHLKYDPLKSFTPIALIGNMPNILVVNSRFKAADFQAFREATKNGSEDLNAGTAGPCSFGQVMLEHLNQALGTSIRHVPYRGSGPAVSDLVGGSLDIMMDIYPLVGPHIKTGKLRALAVAWPERLAVLPDVPTFDELGLPVMNTTSWYGIVAPAQLPAARLTILANAIAESLQDPKLKRRFAEASIYPSANATPEVFKTFLKEQFDKESAFIQARNMGGN
ncbi:tripartite tricarboxylate transporter substrate binding protein BugE [Achromobacter pestifer]